MSSIDFNVDNPKSTFYVLSSEYSWIENTVNGWFPSTELVFFLFMESFWSKNNKKQTNTLPLVIKFESNIITIINFLRQKLDKSVVKISLSLLFLYSINEPNGFQLKNSDWYMNVSRCVCDCLPSLIGIIPIWLRDNLTH